MVQDITPAYDAKLQELMRLIDEKQRHPINPGNRKSLFLLRFQILLTICIRMFPAM